MFRDNLSEINARLFDWYNHLGMDITLLHKNIRTFCYSIEEREKLGSFADPQSRWANFNDASILLYPKGNSTTLLKIVELESIEVQGSPTNKNILIPLLDPCYNFISGIFSGSPRISVQYSKLFSNIIEESFSKETLELCKTKEGHLSNVLLGHYPLFNEADFDNNFKYYNTAFSKITQAVTENIHICLDAAHTMPLSVRLLGAFNFLDDDLQLSSATSLIDKNIVGIDFIRSGLPSSKTFVDFFKLDKRAYITKLLGQRKETHQTLFRMAYECWTYTSVSEYYKLRQFLNNEYILCRALLSPNSATGFFASE